MSMPANVDVDAATRDALSGLSLGDLEALGEALELREAAQENSGLDARTFSLVKIASLVALDAPPAAYLWQVANALEAGATAGDILGVECHRVDRGAPVGRGPVEEAGMRGIGGPLGSALPRATANGIG